MSSTTIFVRVNDHPEINSLILFPNMTHEEIRALFYAAADIPEVERDIVVKLTLADGTIVPMGPFLPENTIEKPYYLTVKSTKSQTVYSKQGVLDVRLNEIATTLNELKGLSTLKDHLSTLHKRIEESEKMVNMNPLVATSTNAARTAVKHFTKVDARFQNQAKYVFTQETRDYLKQPSFNNWQWEENEMAALLEHMFTELGLVEHYNIDLPTLRRFLHAIKANYNNNPFHNFRHCFCVSQMLYGLIHVTNLVSKLDYLDKLILLVSAICHDLDHPGFNNTYQVNAKTDLALLYNDQSPLENHHCAMAFTILKDPELNILRNVPEKEWWEVRKGIIRCILATDMAKHGEYMNKLKLIVDKFDINEKEHRELLQLMLVKCSDISNEARPADVADPWVDALLEEFFTQSDLEKKQGLPVAPFMDREKVTKSGAQVGFIGFVMIPLFELMAKILPEIETGVLVQIKKAHNYYKELAAKQQAEQQAKLASASSTGK